MQFANVQLDIVDKDAKVKIHVYHHVSSIIYQIQISYFIEKHILFNIKACQNGQCINRGGSFICQCPPGYSGNRCEIKDPCTPNPCVNGQCMNQGGNYLCQCPPGYSGQRCEIKDPCQPNP